MEQSNESNLNSADFELGWQHLVSHYERCLSANGRSPAGVDWPNGKDLALRFDKHLEILSGCNSPKPELLDLGCGPGLLLDFLNYEKKLPLIKYQGIDLSQPMIDSALKRWPNQSFSVRNIIANPLPKNSVDVVIMNGVLTESLDIPRVTMIDMAQQLIKEAANVARHGVAFNVMNPNVDWRRTDLFYWSFDEVAQYVIPNISRHVTFKADYGLYEYTVFIWHEANTKAGLDSPAWWV